MNMDLAIQPVDVVFHQASGRMSMSWSDGASGVLAASELRAACKCAECEAARRRGRPVAVTPGIRLRAIESMGEFGLQLIFDDGHERGIYPWAYLHALLADPTPAETSISNREALTS